MRLCFCVGGTFKTVVSFSTFILLMIFYPFLVREQLKELTKQFDKSENDLKALQSVGQIVGEVLKQLTEDKCMFGISCFRQDFLTSLFFF